MTPPDFVITAIRIKFHHTLLGTISRRQHVHSLGNPSLLEVGQHRGSDVRQITAQGAVEVGHQGKHLLLPVRVDFLDRLCRVPR